LRLSLPVPKFEPNLQINLENVNDSDEIKESKKFSGMNL